jgi:HK97 family phage portal protein
LHLLLHGNAFLAHVYNSAGSIVALSALHPQACNVRWATLSELESGDWPDGKVYTASLLDGKTKTFSSRDLTHIPSMSLDGLSGMSVLTQARNCLGTATAGDRAAAKMFGSGALISGIITADEEVTEEEAKSIKRGLDKKLMGWQNAAEIAVVNKKLKFTPWTLSAVDAQFIQSREFQIEEIARWFGVPPFMLMQTSKQTSWGTGIESQQRGLSREVLGPWATLFEQRLARLLPGGRLCEFDFSGLERPTPEQEVALLAQKVDAGLLTLNEARTVLNLAPLVDGDLPRYKGFPLSTPLEPAPTVVTSPGPTL